MNEEINKTKKFWKIERSRRLSIIFGILIVCGVLLLAIAILSGIKVTPHRTYTNNRFGCSIEFPAYWKIDTQPKGGALVVFIVPPKSALDPYQENFNISIKDLPREINPDYLNDIIIKQVTAIFGDYLEFSKSMPAIIAGYPGYRLSFYGYHPQSKKLQNPIQYVTAWTVVGTRIYILTYTGLKDNFPQNEKKVEDMIRSFKVFPPKIK